MYFWIISYHLDITSLSYLERQVIPNPEGASNASLKLNFMNCHLGIVGLVQSTAFPVQERQEKL